MNAAMIANGMFVCLFVLHRRRGGGGRRRRDNGQQEQRKSELTIFDTTFLYKITQ